MMRQEIANTPGLEDYISPDLKSVSGIVRSFKQSVKDWWLVILVGIFSIGANLPEHVAESWGIDRRYLLAVLISFVGIALVRYLKFTLLLVVVLLSVGANLPADIAKELNVDTNIMLFGLIVMVFVSLASRILKMPTGLETDKQKTRSQSSHGGAALFNAVLKGRIFMAQTLLKQGANINIRTSEGTTPLMAAASKGYADIIKLLVDNGADIHAKNNKGESPLAITVKSGFHRAAELLRSVGAKE